MNIKYILLFEILLFSVLFLSACPSGSDKNETFRGKEGEPCYLDGTCDTPLICVSDICIQDNSSQYDCGNGVKEDSEECDQNDFGTAPSQCSFYGYLSGNVKCSSECSLDFSNCVRSLTCGNNIIEDNEECDGTDFGTASTDCVSYGNYYGGTVGCTDNCSLDFSSCQSEAICGNGVKEGTEECDGSDFGGISASCGDHGYQPAGDVVCTDCTLDFSACTPLETCGDGIVNAAEECDGNDMGTNPPTCSDLGYYTGTVTCSTACTYNTSGCSGRCGDSVIQYSFEECDVTVGSSTCTSVGFINGNLSCDSGCSFITSGCNQYKQWGTSSNDTVITTLADSAGNVYVLGTTEGSLYATNAGSEDIYVVKYSASGQILWSWQYGTAEDDIAYNINIDSSGNIYVAGATKGVFYGAQPTGSTDYYDSFIVKLSPGGTKLASTLWGTDKHDFAMAIFTEGNSVYVTGGTYGAFSGYTNAGNVDLFITKLDNNLNLQWTYQTGGTGSDFAWGGTVGSGTLYLVGAFNTTSYSNGDAFIGAYSSTDGHQIWKHDFLGYAGTDELTDIVYDSGYLYACGSTEGDIAGNHGGTDVFYTKFNTSGSQIWVKQVGTSAEDTARSIVVVGGYVYMGGWTSGTMGTSSSGGSDVFISKIDSSNGNIVITKQWGTSSGDTTYTKALSFDAVSFYLGISTSGSFPGFSNQGGNDAAYMRVPIKVFE